MYNSLQLVLLSIIFLIYFSTAEEYYDHLKLPLNRRFIPLWNSHTEICKSEWNITIDLEKYGIVANYDQKWNGEHMNIFYQDSGLWPKFDENSTQPINGGIPQLGNLTAHLTKMADDIKSVLNDTNYQGMAVIDFEYWRPLYKRLWNNKMEIYRNASEALVRQEHPSWNTTQIKAEAERQFELAAKQFMLKTLQLGRKLRPKALWGYYGFPRCYKIDTNSSSCTNTTKEDNDKLMWLFNESTVILPSIYLNQKSKKNPFDYVQGNILEAMRVGNQTGNRPLPIFAYVRLVYTYSDIFLNENDMYATVTQSAELGASGVIIWGASADETKSFCEKLKPYIEVFFGPLVKRLSSIAEECSTQYCSSNGRCQFKMSPLKQFKMSDFLDMSTRWMFVRCNCDSGWEGRDCSLPSYNEQII